MNRLKKMLIILFSLLIVLIIGIAVFINQPSFGRNPCGSRLERIQQSPHYKDGQFQNELPTTVMTGNKGMVRSMWEFLTKKKPNLRPQNPIPSVKTDLHNLPKDKDYPRIQKVHTHL